MSALVLVAEDSATVRAALRMHLEAHGYSVVEAEDGEEALAVAGRERPDVILLDVEMPVLDGHAVLGALQENSELCDVPVVFLTGRRDADDMVACLGAGAHDYLVKPFEAAELVARVSAAVRVKHLQDELRRRNEELDLVSRIDSLTRLWNRRHLEERLDALCSGARRHGFEVSVLVIDLDHFKRVNDSHGHAVGDAVLRAVASCVFGHMRAEDVASRWGGEEFVVMVPFTGPAGSVAVGERIRAGIETLRIDVSELVASGSAAASALTGSACPAGEVRVTASIGICAAAGGEAVPAALLAAADRALYEAKAAGRNRVVLAH
ncbi:MAG: two-component system, cell cycle response regulator [Acidimicrobiaceae bacterium]|jgi:diguanylate cyclase (GGDEF)-like protein|nr:two-component system, cell cycle response regulator [Acidimicrobiaceae bacterium]